MHQQQVFCNEEIAKTDANFSIKNLQDKINSTLTIEDSGVDTPKNDLATIWELSEFGKGRVQWTPLLE